MLDAETKARIDSARDILVGKVPDPKSQVEQITIALIYKFMNDMDRQSEDLDGKATFFSGEFKKYAWGHLLDNRLGGHERLLLYAEGIEKMNENKNIPQLFRDIFRGVFLPYRDPETLNLFLKEINGFTYDHSERLGDAFEYLLSVMDSQGDAGQFRTPRHIIDFIVKVIGPQKHETVLDPACGTAGFLISAYKHILANNAKERPGDRLSADERGRLMTSFCGYDISPDMVRLSRVNLYLHGFANPRIYEYDTLTSEERWDERYDLLMANPPFMTPKGGIRPHNRFSIKAKRSEVLFVDYIAEHLNPGGRAGVIVPEGIIFQSQNAYKKLRRMLVENYLWAVVSLPAGVFNPYSGVKTSILFLDRNFTKRTDEVLFVKVENDGFDLGAQRRPIDKNDLPEALELLIGYKETQKTQENGMTLCVTRKRLLDNPDCNLSGDRYRETVVRANAKWPMVRLEEACLIDPPKTEVRHLPPDTEVSFVPMAALEEHTVNIHAPEVRRLGDVLKGYTYFRNGDVLLAKITPCFENGKCVIADNLLNGIGFGTTEFIVIRPKTDKLLPELVYYCVTRPAFVRRGLECMTGSAGQQRVPANCVSEAEIPLPPLDEQERIVAELEGYRKIIEGARQVIANYKPTIRIDLKWPVVELNNIADMKRGPFGGSLKKEIFVRSGYKVYEQKHAIQRDITIGTYFIDEEKYREMEAFAVAPGDLLISCSGTMGRVYILPSNAPKGVINQALLKVTPHSDKVLGEYLEAILTTDSIQERYFRETSGSAIQNVSSMLELRSISIPLPPLAIQSQIMAEMQAERVLVESNRKLIEIFEAKIRAKLDEIWGEPNGAT